MTVGLYEKPRRQQGLPRPLPRLGCCVLADPEGSRDKARWLSVLSPNTSSYSNQLSIKGDGNSSSDLRASLNVSTVLCLGTCHSGCTKIPPVLPSLSPVHSTIHSVTASASCTILPSLISPHLLAD